MGRQGWITTDMHTVSGVQDLRVLSQLSRQGTGRFSCLARTASIVGIIERVNGLPPSLVVGRELFSWGITSKTYQFCKSQDAFNEYYAAYERVDEAWVESAEKFGDMEFNDFCRTTKMTMNLVASCSVVFGLKANGYCFDFAVRKIVIAESYRRYCGAPLLATSQDSVDPDDW